LSLSYLAIATALLAAGSLAAQVSSTKSGASAKPGAKSTSHRKSTRRAATAKPAAVTASNKAATNTGKAATNTGKAATNTGKPATNTAKAVTTTAVHRASKTGTSKTGKKPTVAVARRSNQQQPTQDRYREIQQSLSEKGYFAGQPDGNWGPESTDALKRFQRDQSLTEDGKLGALSLIALGLGPRRPMPAEVAADAAPAEKAALEKQLDKPTH
jgi:peptidoglycan hydrolase-like protein with peptidoglycan-binding domain